MITSCRVTVAVDRDHGIIGVGDDPTRKEAEKLAALDAVFQLARAGLVSDVHRAFPDTVMLG
jgi:small subunit ribosomal protein S24e